MLLLVLNVACHDDQTMEITSHHLEPTPITDEFGLSDGNEVGEEQAKRGPYFGHPVGKREFWTVSGVVSLTPFSL